MPKYLTIQYGDRSGYERTPPQVRDAAHDHDKEFLRPGALIGIAGSPVQVRNLNDAAVHTTNGAFMSSCPSTIVVAQRVSPANRRFLDHMNSFDQV